MIDNGEDVEKVVKLEDRRKVSLRFKAVRIIEHIVENMYGEGALILMQKQGYSIEPDDIKEAKKTTMKRMVQRYLDGRNTKELSGVISELKKMAEKVRFNNAAMTAQIPEGLK